MKKRVIFLVSIILLVVLAVSCGQDNVSNEHKGKTLVTIDGNKITTGDVDNFKKYRQDNLSDKQALEMIVEREVLYKEAEKQGKIVSLNEAQIEANNARNNIEQYGTEKDKNSIKNIINDLKINEDKYWNDYYPKQLIKLMTIGQMTKGIKDKIYAEIIKKHSDWGQIEIDKGLKEAHDKVINDLKVKYKVKYVNE